MIASLDEVKTALGVQGSTDDTFLTSQAQLASDAIEAYCQRVFNKRTYTQTFYARDEQRSQMALAVWPVVSVTSITQDGTLIPADEYRVHKPSGTITRDCVGFFFGKQTVAVYVAGFEQGDIPLILKNVVYSIVGGRYAKKQAGADLNFGSDVQRVSIPGVISIDFDYTLTNNDQSTPFGGLLGDYLNMIDYYRSDRSILGDGKLTYIESVP